ncbi:Hsp70 family protein [Alienimonas californiensis]|uniref:Chaperone protein DnaK n=1 Tax=Alienimonas californiensis TaxID=2527989 RepID=A0A517P9R2_9PLAN|nr:Hsp70 family protein [Alienimonas californiensis]QDT16095.1 Chaperone protein DnaK [Alienimonas californiensis]
MYSVGIDLGTTNSVLASCPISGDGVGEDGAGDAPAVLPVPQVVAPGTVESRDALPSFCYLAPEAEADGLALPWAAGPAHDGPGYAVGEYARQRAVEAPDRVVGTAKSWLGHAGVDRRQPILPWDAGSSATGGDVSKISPVEASARLLRHLAAAWDQAHPDAPLSEQAVTLTVPASFDAAARDLTREAAKEAGFPADFVLLEEPQAAVYAHLADRGDDWRKDLSPGDALLVVDVGGGTTDFSLVSVTDREGDLELERVAVGRHLLVGGDNMDLAVAHHAAGLLAEKGVTPDPWQSVALWHACRTAKERLLGVDAPEHAPVAVLGRGRKLIGGTVSVDLSADDVRRLVLDGFFPQVAADEKPQNASGGGFVQLGLPYESDPAVTKHLAAFLAQHPDVVPTHLLLNGGVFRSAPLRERLRETLAGWLPAAPTLLDRPSAALDQAVARGAAFYGATKKSGGVRIRGGTGRSYYVGIETAGLAIPGAPRPLSALCVVPQGMEEGSETAVPVERLPGGGVGVTVGRPARFRFFASPSRPDDVPGDLLTRWSEEELEETDPIETTLDPTAAGSGDAVEGQVIPVNFHAAVTELGELTLSARQTNGDGVWTLGFDVREE